MSEEPYHSAAAAARRPGGGRRHTFWLVAAAAIGAVGLSCASPGERAAVLRLAPVLGPVYAAIGLPVLDTGPSVIDLSSRITETDGRSVLTVEGEIANSGHAPVRLADLRVAVAGSDGREIYHWTEPSPKSRLSPGETISFRAKLDAPPANAQTVSVRFVRPGKDSRAFQ